MSSSTRAARLAELRTLRATGKTRISTYEVDEGTQLYDEVNEEDYKKVVRRRLDEDDFVVDDNGEGYADDGREEWNDRGSSGRYGRRGGYYASDSGSGSEAEEVLRGKAGKRKREERQQQKDKINAGINKYFSANTASTMSKPKPAATAEDAEFMANLLGEVDTNLPTRMPASRTRTIKSESRRKTRVLSPPIGENVIRKPKKQAAPVEDTHMQATPPPSDSAINDNGNDYIAAIEDDIRMGASDMPFPSSPVEKVVERKKLQAIKSEKDSNHEDEDDDEMMEIAQAVGQDVPTASVNISGTRPAPKQAKRAAYPSPESSSPARPAVDQVDPSAWNDVADKLNIVSSPVNEHSNVGKLKAQDVLSDDGSLRFFWLDYTEINGSLCLFGKVKNRTSDSFGSCFIKVDNILRKLFFLPRESRQANGSDTSEEVEMTDVYNEVDGLMSKLHVPMHKIKPCSRKYAFELPGIPKEADYLKLLYPYDKPALAQDLSGETFSHVFGTNTTLFEQFVLWKNIMGPCWLKIDPEGADFNAVNNASWCKLELQVAKPNSLSVLGEAENLEAPPLTLMSLSLRSTFKAKENKQEILMASVRIYEDVSLSDTTPPEKLPSRTFTVMCPYGGEAYPVGFKLLAEKHRGTIRMERNESALLSMLMAIMQKTDPDVLMGHRLDDIDYGLLLSRMREKKTPGWHRIGRLKRSAWPKTMGKGNSFFSERLLASGRLLCDLANDLGKSLMTKCQSWSLNEMCELVLGKGNVRRDFDNENALKTWASTREGLMNYLRHCEADTYYIAAIALKVQMLPLTKVLTNLAGNSWARTLSGTRAERNEYILLHEFHRNKFICPDKIYGKGKQKAEEENADGEEGVDAKKKDKYKGGLVFEPEKGLYDKFILVMDFNSLYPSIIQEYNICFTTVNRANFSEEEEQVPEVPEEQDQGILPRLIATLVGRRREVKKLMKNKNATSDQLATWDIKQLALKLTANSMYGCLGYTKSRFYARPLAMLTTAKGREILRSTKDLAENAQLRVIYGDTDSVMINTNADNAMEALKLGNEFKRSVNERYKLLEIDIDNVFRRLLLHAKKKYAAINMVEVDGKYVDKLEVKGLDMRRREYCGLSKETSTKLLNFLLSGEEPDIVVEKIHEHLRELAEKMRQFEVPVQKYTIFTQLGKDPKEYPNANSMPSVQVALRLMAKGKHVKAKDVMSFIITGENGGSAEKAAHNAYTLDEVVKADSGLKPDVDYYLHKQILPPVERLCAPISGTDITRLAECLGLDTSKYRISSSGNNSGAGGISNGNNSLDTEIQPLSSQVPDAIRFKDCTPLHLNCPRCQQIFTFSGLVPLIPPPKPSSAATTTTTTTTTPEATLTPTGLKCPHPHCNSPLQTLSLTAQLESQIRQHTSRYYAGWLVCDDAACGSRTRAMRVYGHRCLGPRALGTGCNGRMMPEYSERMLYEQLLFLQAVFDVDRARDKVAAGAGGNGDGRKVATAAITRGTNNGGNEDDASVAEQRVEKINALAEINRQRFGIAKNTVTRYLEKSGRLWVAMDGLFGFAIRAKAVKDMKDDALALKTVGRGKTGFKGEVR